MIIIKNNVRKIKIHEGKLKANVQAMLDFLHYADFDLGIWLTTNATIRKYNHQFRKKDKATDIVSFPYHTTLKAGKRITVKSDDDKNLGDIIISLEYVKKTAVAFDRTFDQHLICLLAHGIAHLLGHDHMTDEDHKAMEKVEQQLLRAAPHH